jgi:hypothetical protein
MTAAMVLPVVGPVETELLLRCWVAMHSPGVGVRVTA